LTCQEL